MIPSTPQKLIATSEIAFGDRCRTLWARTFRLPDRAGDPPAAAGAPNPASGLDTCIPTRTEPAPASPARSKATYWSGKRAVAPLRQRSQGDAPQLATASSILRLDRILHSIGSIALLDQGLAADGDADLVAARIQLGRELRALKVLKQLLGLLWNNQDLTYSSLRDPRREAVDLFHRARSLVWKIPGLNQLGRCAVEPAAVSQQSSVIDSVSLP